LSSGDQEARPPLRPRADEVTARTRNDTAVRQLVRELSVAVSASAALPIAAGEEQVVLTVVIDGVRYTLTRSALEVEVHAELSAREFEIARMVAHGYTNKTIAAVLEISCWTVDTYLRRIFTKLGVRSRSMMVTRLTRAGILDARDGTPEWSAAWQAHVARNDPPKLDDGDPPAAQARRAAAG
jgi:two-component system, NarL family, nitrate/nitrite response regulator NarL